MFKKIMINSMFVASVFAVAAPMAHSDDGILMENKRSEISAYGIGGDLGIGGGFSMASSHTHNPNIDFFKVGVGYSQRRDGQGAFNFSILARDEFGQKDTFALSSDLMRVNVTPFKRELNIQYGLATIGVMDRSADGKSSAFINARPITLAAYRDSSGNEASTGAESAVDLAFRHSLSSVMSINAEGSFALGWGSDARSSEIKGTLACKLGEKSPWCIDVTAISQTVAFKDNSNVSHRDAAQSVRLGVTFTPAN